MCIRQASMFDDLRSRLISHGFTNIEYNIISMVKGANKLHELEAVSPNIPVHQETLEDKAVETLGAGKDHFLILDSCNRLVYQVIMPWSFLFYPYVKAAILSAYNDKPCGDCDGQMTEEGYTTVTIIKRIPLLDIFKATFPEQKYHKKHSHLKKHGHHHHHHHHHIHSHPHHHHHHHHHDSYPVYYNFEEKDGHKMSVGEQYDALKTFLSQHLHLLNINNDTFEIHSHGSENDYKKFYNTESSFVNSATQHNTQSGVFDNTVVYTDELTKVPEGTDPIRVEQIEGNVQEGHHTVSKDEVLSENAPPLQVTLWYPHYHVYNGQRLKDHYFIVLHSKDPKYHGHVVPETTEDKGIGDTFAGEKEHQTGHHINTTHQFHEQSLGHTGGSHSHVGVQTDESHLTGSNSIQDQNFGSTHAGEHVTHTTEQNFTSGSQNMFGHGYSYNTTHTETSETHHHSTFDTQSGHTENEIIDDKKKTDLFGKDISGTTGAGQESTVSHESSHGTSVSTADHVSSQSGHHEIAGQAGHGYSTATNSIDKNKGIHHESDNEETQAHGTININKDGQHQTTHTVSHEGTGAEAHTHISSSVAGQDHDHKNLDGSSTSGTVEGTSVHTENNGFVSSGSQNQIGGNQHGTNSQSESSAHGDNTQSESSSSSTSQGTYSFSSSSSSSISSSNGIYPSVVHNTITEDNRDKTVSHEQSGSGQTNLHHQGGQIHDTSTSHDSSSVQNHTTVVISEQSSGSHDSGIHHTTGGGTEGHKIDNYGTQSQSTHSHQKSSSSSDTSDFSSSGGSESHSTSYTTGGHDSSGHSSQTHTSESVISGGSGSHSTGYTAGGHGSSGHSSQTHTSESVISGGSENHSTGYTAGGHGGSDHSSQTHTSESVISGGSGSHSTGYTAGGHGSSGHSSQTHASDSGSNTFKHTTGHDGVSHSTNYVSSGGHNTESQGSYSSYSHGSSQNSTYTHSEGAHNHAAGAHVTEGGKTSGAGHSSGSHGTYGSVGQSSSSHHGGSSTSHGNGGPDDRIIFRDNSHEEFDFHKFLEKQERERKGKTHLRTMDEEDAEPIEKTKDGEELINHYSKILPWIEFPVD